MITICAIGLFAFGKAALSAPINIEEIEQKLSSKDVKVRLQALLQLREVGIFFHEEAIEILMSHAIKIANADSHEILPSGVEGTADFLQNTNPLISTEESSLTELVFLELVKANPEKNVHIFEKLFQGFVFIAWEIHERGALQSLFLRIASDSDIQERLKKSQYIAVRVRLAEYLAKSPDAITHVDYIFDTIHDYIAMQDILDMGLETFGWIRSALVNLPLLDFEGRPMDPSVIDNTRLSARLLRLLSRTEDAIMALHSNVKSEYEASLRDHAVDNDEEDNTLHFYTDLLIEHCALASQISALLGRIERAYAEGTLGITGAINLAKINYLSPNAITEDGRFVRRDQIIKVMGDALAYLDKHGLKHSFDNEAQRGDISHQAILRRAQETSLYSGNEQLSEFEKQLLPLQDLGLEASGLQHRIEVLARVYMSLSPQERLLALKSAQKLPQSALNLFTNRIYEYKNETAFDTIMSNPSCAAAFRQKREN
jgi:hypothetical protein